MTQPPSGLPPWERPPRQPPTGQPPSGQPWSGQGEPGGAPYGQSPYGQSPYGQSPYGQSPYGLPSGYGRPGRTSRRTVALLVAGGVLLLVVVVAVLVAVVDGGSRDRRPAPAATAEAAGLGNDPTLDRLAGSCRAGDMQACDDLYDRSAVDSAYEQYGDTCAGRQPEGTGTYCTEVFTDAD